MLQGRLKQYITYFFLVLFLSVKMAGLHVLSHSDDKDNLVHCTVCDLTTAQNLLPAITPDLPDFTVNNFEEIYLQESNAEYAFVVNSTLDSDQLFSRPPPSIL
ncbi:hypothetical protein [Pseudozobellia thermophila]|uniref:Uncharacterized protein n=1 Tax=Pseudozobellia thermophila TaxID=192903 RepID=A0A1M6KBD3_9FLAO|nr:hypothetical protein [Pseudozobellia thermophila]SHJ56275.1 hypothetical protein SAMN04488513_1062 [Pseudozobellia thermophila]